MARPAWNRFTGSLVPDGGRIAATRNLLKLPLTQEELAAKAKVSKRTVQNAEAAKPIKASYLRKIAKVLKLDFEQILSEEAKEILKQEAGKKETTTSSTRPSFPEPIADANYFGHATLIDTIIASLNSGTGTVGIHSFGGTGGIGKSTTAILCANRVHLRFPDGLLFIELRGMNNPLTNREVIESVIRAYSPTEKAEDKIADLRNQYRQILQRFPRSMIVLDDVKDKAQIEGMFEGVTPVKFLLTSRRNLAVPGEHHRLGFLEPNDALAMLRSILVDKGTDDELLEVAKQLGYLPFALRVAGEFLELHDLWTAERYLRTIQDESKKLARLKGKRAGQDVEACLALSARQLVEENSEQAMRWQQLAVFPAEFDSYAAAAIWKLDEQTAFDELTELHDRSMIETRNGRFYLHDLMRPVARDTFPSDHPLQPGANERIALAEQRHAEHYEKVLCAANDGGQTVGLATYDLEVANVAVGRKWADAHAANDRNAAEQFLKYSLICAVLYRHRMTATKRLALYERCLEVSVLLKYRDAEARSKFYIGEAMEILGNTQDSLVMYREAAEIFEELGDIQFMAVTVGNIARSHLQRGETDEAIRLFEGNVRVFQSLGDDKNKLASLRAIAGILHHRGQSEKAVQLLKVVAKDYGHISDIFEKAVTMGMIADILHQRGQSEEAIDILRAVQTVFKSLNAVKERAVTMGRIAGILQQRGDTHEAIRICREIIPIFESIGDLHSQVIYTFNLGRSYLIRGYAKDVPLAREHLQWAFTTAEKHSYVEAVQIRQIVANLFGR